MGTRQPINWPDYQNLLNVNFRQTVKKIAAILDKKGIKRIPVVDEGNKLVGIVSRGDILRIICEDEGEDKGDPL